MSKNLTYLLIIGLTILYNCSPSGTNVPNCEITFCENNGTLQNCECICEEGYSGPNCERLNPAFAQKFLDEGLTPFELLNANIPLDSIYGKQYQGGLIFHLNTADKILKVTVNKGLEVELIWSNAMNYAQTLDSQNFSDWYLPNVNELKEIRNLLFNKLDVGNFESDYYWSSETVPTNPDEAYGVYFPNGNVGPIEKDLQNDVSFNYVRPVRQIQL